MPLSTDALIELTALADPLVRRGAGAKASDDAQAAYRIAVLLESTPRMSLGHMMRRANVPPTAVARVSTARVFATPGTPSIST